MDKEVRIFFVSIFFCLSFFPPVSCLQEDSYLWDFGRVKEGTVLKHDFIFTNDTPKLINIKNIDTSCGCTVSQAQKKTILPQENTAIKVAFNTKGYKGEVKQFVYIHTDNPDNPVLKYTIKAEVVKNKQEVK